jgi:phosphatidate cytidylyltransferase
MAFNWTTFRTRALTAVVFVAVMLFGLLWSPLSFFLLFSVIYFGCWFEFQQLIERIDPEYKQVTSLHRYGVMLAGWAIMLYCCHNAFHIGTLSLSSIGWWIGLISVFVLPMSEILLARQHSLKNLGYSIAGIIYISLSWGLLMDLRTRSVGEFFGIPVDFGWVVPVVLIASIWINDTMAYIVGSLIGKTPLSPISPKKTWEGTIGGAILAIVVVALYGKFGFKAKSWELMPWIIIPLIAAIAGNSGDLLESKLKRMAGVKDSGSIMPGHGGFLDRFDSLLLSIPFTWMYVSWFT